MPISVRKSETIDPSKIDKGEIMNFLIKDTEKEEKSGCTGSKFLLEVMDGDQKGKKMKVWVNDQDAPRFLKNLSISAEVRQRTSKTGQSLCTIDFDSIKSISKRGVRFSF